MASILSGRSLTGMVLPSLELIGTEGRPHNSISALIARNYLQTIVRQPRSYLRTTAVLARDDTKELDTTMVQSYDKEKLVNLIKAMPPTLPYEQVHIRRDPAAVLECL